MAKFNPNDLDKVINTVDKYTREALKIIGKDPVQSIKRGQTADVSRTRVFLPDSAANSPAGVMVGGFGTQSSHSGIPASIKDIPQEHRVTIIDDYPVSGSTGQRKVDTIDAILQDKVTLSTESKWESFNELEVGGGIAQVVNAVAQVFRQSLSTRFSSRRMWKSTSPVTLTLPLRFEAAENTFNEVVEPCMKLNRMALPSDGGIGLFGIKLLNPPGPSPFTLPGETTNPGEKITINVGTYLTFNQVVVENVTVTYNKKLDTEGYPISADVAITFQTYEILTKQSLMTAYKTSE